jgi:hypothetical protein
MGVLMLDNNKETDSSFQGGNFLGPMADHGISSKTVVDTTHIEGKAVTNTVNERLIAEVEEAAVKEKLGGRSALSRKMSLAGFRSRKTDAERAAAIEEARNLNGVNPLVTLGGSMFALAAAGGLWALTFFLAEYFALHPIDSDVYFVTRVTAVFRNIVIGLVSLASGFFGVTGMGIFMLGVRVAYGVAKGELDPTPLKMDRKAQEEAGVPDVWSLMMNKKPNRRGSTKGGDNDSSSFGR